jgi:serine/threonine-protein kinase
VHRDLKPENVLVAARAAGVPSVVKLTDFGIAKVMDAPALTFSEQRLGTPGFIAPEYIEGEPAGPLCDLYALGIVLYEMLTGALPFDSRAPAELLAATLSSERIPPSARVQGIPGTLEELVLRMVARKPGDRPRDAFVVQDALAGILRRASGQMPEASLAEVTTPMLPDTTTTESSRSRLTAEIGELRTGEIGERWHSMLGEVTRLVNSTFIAPGAPEPGVERARELVDHARDLVASLERVKATAAEHQGRVDDLEAHGRAFRSSLGNAIDTLSRDRSRERARGEGVAARRLGLETAALALGAPESTEGDALLWERAALETEAARAHAVEVDLTYQISELQKRLDIENEQLDADLVEAAGRLEGALSALRRLTGELVRIVEEASALVA